MSTVPCLLLVLVLISVMLTGTPPVTAQDDRGSYESPTYGYSVSWDEAVWTVDESETLVAEGDPALDRFRLESDSAALYLDGGDFGDADAAGCVRRQSDFLAADSRRSDYRPYVQANGAKLIGEANGVAFAAFQFRRPPPTTSEPFEEVVYIECQVLPDSGISVFFDVFARPDVFEQVLTKAQPVIDSLQLPPGSADQTATLVDEAWFEAQVEAATATQSASGWLSGVLAQSQQSVTLREIATDEQDFYLRARFRNPSDATQAPWDFGVQFRDANGVFYRLIIASEARWFLQREWSEQGIELGPLPAGTLLTAADATNALEIVVSGEVGAFRLNEQAVIGPLDLSMLPGPGDVSVGTGFLEGNRGRGALTHYSSAQLWRLSADSPEPPAATPSPEPTATPTPPPTPTVTPEPTASAIPEPTATPEPTVTATPEPTVTPTPMPTPSPTPEPTATATPEPTATAVPTPTAAIALMPNQVATGSYESPRFGYSLTWDSTWTELNRSSTDFDFLLLTNGPSFVGIIGSAADGANALACRERAVRAYEQRPAFAPVLVDGQPLAGGDDDRAWGVYRFTTGEGDPTAAYFECRALPVQGATVTIALTTPEDAYNTQASLLASLLENLVLPE